MIPLREVRLIRDVYGMCVVTLNGREIIRDNGDVISHCATPDWLAEFGPSESPAEPSKTTTLTVRNCGDCRLWMTPLCPRERHSNYTGRWTGPGSFDVACEQWIDRS